MGYLYGILVDIPEMFGTVAINDFEFYVCPSVCLFAYFLTEILKNTVSVSIRCNKREKQK